MSTGAVKLRTRQGATTDARAELIVHGRTRRLATAAAIVACGVTVGAATIVVPTVHLFSTWAIPLLSIGIAAWATRVRARLLGAQGPCPACGAHVELPGVGAVDDDAVWVRCPACKAPIEIVVGAT